MKWISVEDRLPEEDQAVLLRTNLTNNFKTHTLADGSIRENWIWDVGWLIKGLSAEEVKTSTVITGADQWDNNLRPYCWKTFGPRTYFGQDITHWCAIEDIDQSFPTE